jgi:hypothetical protein
MPDMNFLQWLCLGGLAVSVVGLVVAFIDGVSNCMWDEEAQDDSDEE